MDFCGLLGTQRLNGQELEVVCKRIIDDDDKCLNCANRVAEVRIVHLCQRRNLQLRPHSRTVSGYVILAGSVGYFTDIK
jgi:hypothetical protein